ncbi:MAG: hypothetical protein WCO75_01235, partial [Planctomycetota bacterium]
SPLHRAVRRVLTWTVRAIFALTFLYIAFGAWLWFHEPIIRIDHVAALRAMMPVAASPEQAVWPDFRDQMVAMGLGADDPAHESAGVEAMNAMPYPGNEKWAGACEWLTANAAPLATLRDATRRPVFGFPIGVPVSEADARLLGKRLLPSASSSSAASASEFPMFSILLPHLAPLGTAARILAVDMFAAAEVGDGERATRDAEAGIALSIHAQEGRFLVNDLVGVAMRRMTLGRMMALLEWKPELFTDSQLARMQAAAMSVPAQLQRLNLDSERLAFNDVVQRMYTDNGNGDGWFRPSLAQMEALGLAKALGETNPDAPGDMTQRMAAASGGILSPFAAMYVAGRRDMLDRYNTIISRYEEDTSLPLRDFDHSRGAESDNEIEMMMGGTAERWRWCLVSFLTPALGKASHVSAVGRAVCLATATGYAAERYRRAHGAWPGAASDLVPAFMATVPEDPWSGKPVLMSSDADGFRIWSIGRDGVDDRGDLTICIPAVLGENPGESVSTYPDVRVPWNAPQNGPTTDWVWFAPRGDFTRWSSP